MLKKLIHSNLGDLWLLAGVEGGIFLLLEAIICCVTYVVRSEDGVSVGWIMFPIAGIVSLIVVTGHAAVTFDLALRFGQTRRRALGQFLALSAFETAFGLVLAAGLYALDRFLCPALWTKLAGLDGWVLGRTGRMQPLSDIPGMEADPGRVFVNISGEIVPLPERTLLVRDFTLDWYWLLLIFAIALAGGIVIGTLIQRFGQKGIWVVWGFCLTPVFLTQVLQWEIFDRLSRSCPMLLSLLMGLFSAGLLLWSLWSMLHAVVRA